MRGRLSNFELGPVGLVTFGALWLFWGATPVDARITSISYTTSQPYGSQSFGSVGQYQELDGTATGELDPGDPLNSIITDINLAPPLSWQGPVFVHLLDPRTGRPEQ